MAQNLIFGSSKGSDEHIQGILELFACLDLCVGVLGLEVAIKGWDYSPVGVVGCQSCQSPGICGR